MTPRTFFKIIIKIFGLYAIFQLVFQVPALFLAIGFNSVLYGIENVIYSVVFFLITAVLAITVVYLTIFKTDKLIDWFQLDKGFEEEKFEFNLHRSSILRIVLIVFGMVLIVLTLPDLLLKIYNYFVMRQIQMANPDSTKSLIVEIIRTVIGIIIVAYSKSIVNFIELQRKK